MFNSEGKLLVIHEYPTPALQPFLNPVCKGTYDALPKIYGPHKKKRFLLHSFTPEHSQHRCLRDCCVHRYEQHRSKTDVKPARPKIKFDRTIARTSVKEGSDNGASANARLNRGKNKVALNPILKQFQPEELLEAQSKHKVFRPVGRGSSMDIQSLSDSRAKQVKSAALRDSHMKKTSHPVSSSEYVQTEEGYCQLGGNDKDELRVRTKTQPQNTQAQRYYEYLQNDPKLYDSKNAAELRKTDDSKKQSQESQGDALSISSGAIKQRKDSTMFHRFKQRQAIGTFARKSKAYSVLSNGLFKIPQEDQFEDYLLNYKPINPNFDIKKLVKEDNFYIVPLDGRVYFGQIVDKKKHGQGITVSEKEIFQGNYEQDFKTKGFEKNRDGTYTGEYLNGKRHGKGKFVWYNGEVFEGEWKNGKKNGLGIWKSPKGDYYEGQWVENRQNGQGIFFHIGGSQYKGEFKDFLKHGRGQEQFPNGDKYDGSYSLGKPHGKGKYSWANGDSYQGDFEEGSRSGWGVLRRKSGETYEGYFKNDLKHGQGREHFKSGQSFEGTFKEGQRVTGTLRTKEGAEIRLTE